MTLYKKESHIRSVLKGVSWRIVATADTILVVLLITCLFDECSLEIAIKIGSIEFFIKFLVYYLHERVWQRVLVNKRATQKRTLQKSLSWRIVATTMTFIISGTVLESFDQIALYIAITELFTKFVLYYLHERLWLMLPLGKIRNYVLGKIR
ncbi:DUF2061 domain-containing protein [Winogradskyella poriferorum]|uniref:DUF2061 domain-containing protein n=1 Tax=Winogradskyella poriferorum TaxID=307627 RepID=UPI003D65F74F